MFSNMSSTDTLADLTRQIERGVNIRAINPIQPIIAKPVHDYSFGLSKPHLRPIVPKGA